MNNITQLCHLSAVFAVVSLGYYALGAYLASGVMSGLAIILAFFAALKVAS